MSWLGDTIIRAAAILSRQGTATTFITAGATFTGISDSPSTPDDLYMVYNSCGQSAVDAPSGRSKEKADDVTSFVDVQPCNQTQLALSAIRTLVSEIE